MSFCVQPKEARAWWLHSAGDTGLPGKCLCLFLPQDPYLVAAITLTLTLISLSEPTLVILFSCNAQHFLPGSQRHVTDSSRNRVPPSACSNFPFVAFMAEVKDPSRVRTTHFQWVLRYGSTIDFNKGIFKRFFSCSQRATSSFSGSVDPVISTLASVAATLSMISHIRFMAEIAQWAEELWNLSFQFLFSWTKEVLSLAFLRVIRIRFKSRGFSMKS